MTKALKKGSKVKTIWGQKLTVVEVVGNMVRTYEDKINLYHIEKLIF